MGDQVVGHYVPCQDGQGYKAVLANSTDLFKALVNDDLQEFEKLFASPESGVSCSSSSSHTVLFWSASASSQDEAKVEAKSRTLAMLATQHGSVRVLSFLLSKGSCPTEQAKDGQTCYTLMDQGHPNAASIKGMLDDAAGNFSRSPPSSQAAHHGAAAGQTAAGALDIGACLEAAAGVSGEGLGKEEVTCDLTRPEYSTDWFRMYCFKVLRCSKRYAHDWRACPFAHPTENARRRDPRDFMYSSLVCPDYRQGCCVRGDTCQYAHGVFESWLHPSRYRTQLCKDTAKCDRVVCFFAHSLDELRTPENSFVPPPEERLRVPEPMQAVLGIAPVGLPHLQVPQLDTGFAPDQNLELLMQQQGMSASTSTNALNRAASSNTSFGSSSQAATGISGATVGDDQQQQASAACGGDAPGSSSAMAQPSPKQQQLVSPTALPMPRMSNAFARKHGLDPKENPLVNLQRLAMQQQMPGQPGTMGGAPAGNRRGKQRGNSMQQGYPPQAAYSPQPQYQQMYQQQYQQSAGHPPALLQPLMLQPQPLLQPGMLSPAAAAAYYGAPSPMQAVQHSPASPMLDPHAMALLFGGMSMGGPPLSPAGHPAMAAGMASPLHGYALGGPSPTVAVPAGMLSPMGAGMLSPEDSAAALGAQSPLPQPMMHLAPGLHSPY